MAMEKIVGCDILISYPNFSGIFTINVDASKMQPGRVISSKWKFHCIFLTQVNPHLINYSAKVRKLLSIAEMLKIITYRSIRVLYRKLITHLTNKSLTTDIA